MTTHRRDEPLSIFELSLSFVCPIAGAILGVLEISRTAYAQGTALFLGAIVGSALWTFLILPFALGFIAGAS